MGDLKFALFFVFVQKRENWCVGPPKTRQTRLVLFTTPEFTPVNEEVVK